MTKTYVSTSGSSRANGIDKSRLEALVALRGLQVRRRRDLEVHQVRSDGGEGVTLGQSACRGRTVGGVDARGDAGWRPRLLAPGLQRRLEFVVDGGIAVSWRRRRRAAGPTGRRRRRRVPATPQISSTLANPCGVSIIASTTVSRSASAGVGRSAVGSASARTTGCRLAGTSPPQQLAAAPRQRVHHRHDDACRPRVQRSPDRRWRRWPRPAPDRPSTQPHRSR